MAVKQIWASMPIEYKTVIDTSNNQLDVTFNGVVSNLLINVTPYMTNIIRHESRLVEEINRVLEEASIDVKCKMGIFAKGVEKTTYIVYEYNEDDTFSYDGSFRSIIGDVGFIKDIKDVIHVPPVVENPEIPDEEPENPTNPEEPDPESPIIPEIPYPVIPDDVVIINSNAEGVDYMKGGSWSSGQDTAFDSRKPLSDERILSACVGGSAIANTGSVLPENPFSGQIINSVYGGLFISWQSGDKDNGDTWIGYNFPIKKHIRKISLQHATSENTPFPRSILIQSSDNGTSWTTVETINNVPLKKPYEWSTYEIISSNPAKMWRIKNNDSEVLDWQLYQVQMFEEYLGYVDGSVDMDYGHSYGFAPTGVDIFDFGDQFLRNTIVFGDVISKGKIVDFKLKNYEKTIDHVIYYVMAKDYKTVLWRSEKVYRVDTDVNLTNANLSIDRDFRIGIVFEKIGGGAPKVKYYKNSTETQYWHETLYHVPSYKQGNNNFPPNVGEEMSLIGNNDIRYEEYYKVKGRGLPFKVRVEPKTI